MKWSSLGRAFSIGLHVLDIMEQNNINIKGVSTTKIKEAVGTAMTTGITVKNAITEIRSDLKPAK